MNGQPRDPFSALGLDLGADLTDDDVRIAWRRIAAATHPDRGDGGDPVAFAIAAAAYADLRTAYGRGEARADVLLSRPGRQARSDRRFARAAVSLRLRRPVRLAVRAVAAAAAAALGILIAGPGPAGPALAAGAATWLVLTIRRDPAHRSGAGQPGSGPVATGRAGSADHADQEPT